MRRRVIGFTGTRKGMTPSQQEAVRAMVEGGGWALARHGDCVGADAEFHEICRDVGVPVVLHPPVNSDKRAFCTGYTSCRAPLPPLDRNDAIVDGSEAMIATPAQMREVQRGSGTWYTVRQARRIGVPVSIVYPDGTVKMG
jgi:hypothetical protein